MVDAKTPAASRKIYTTDYVFDSFGRMLQMTYPDGENLYYAYDNGGLLSAAWGEKRGNRYNYINSLTYDEFGQRKQIAHGNGVRSSYSYDDKTRRLDGLVTSTPEGRIVQNITYGYDLVGNVLKIQNNISTPTNTALPAGPVVQLFDYDDLYQLKNADGEYTFGPGKGNRYKNEFSYDSIGNFTRKSQLHRIIQPSAEEHLPKETNYLLDYKYGSSHPHAVTDAGDKLYGYDNNGNMTGWTSKTNGQRRIITWNEENRVKEIQDNGRSTYFLYDDAGERVLKRGQHGETFYVNRFYSIRNGELGTKSIYAGNTRIVSKLVKTPNTVTDNTATTVPGIQGLDNGQGKKLGIIRRLDNGTTTTAILPPEEKDQFFYHGDHLGSSNMITDAKGSVYQHLEYFPYGETWIEEGGSYGGNTPGYKFTGKELDPETGLYYFGARYYEPVISRWISADPILGKYLPSVDKEKESKLPGMGGVFNPRNIGVYSYSHANPIKCLDPDGNVTATERAKADSTFYNYKRAEMKFAETSESGNLYKYGAKGAPGERVDCSGLTQHAYPSLPAGTSAQIQNTSEISVEKAIKGDLIFFYEGGHVGVITGVNRDENGKVSEITFGHTTKSSGAHESTISLTPKSVQKNREGDYWSKNLNSIRTFQPETDPLRPGDAAPAGSTESPQGKSIPVFENYNRN